MSNPSLRRVPPLFLGVIPSKTYDSWAGDPIFLGWGSDPDLWPQMVKIWRSTKWSKKGPHIFLTRAKCIEFQGEQLWVSLEKLTFVRFLIFLETFAKQIPKSQKKKHFFNENQSCSPWNSVQDALRVKAWGPLFDDFACIFVWWCWVPGGILGVSY